MKTKMAMLAAFLFTALLGVRAQQGQMSMPSVEDRVKMTMEKMAPLNLTADEQTKTEAVFTDFYNAQMKMFEDARSSGTRPDREAFQKLTSDRDDKLKAIFTDDQFKKYTSDIEPTLRRHRGDGNNGGGQSSGTN